MRSFNRAAFTQALVARGIRIPALSRECGLNPSYCYQISNGYVPGAPARETIAKVLGVPAETLWPVAESLPALPTIERVA